MCGPSRPCVIEPVFLYFISVFLYATWTNVCEGVCIYKQRRRRVVGGAISRRHRRPHDSASPVPWLLTPHVRFFQGYEKLRIETEIFRKNTGDFLGTFGGSPRSSPRGRLDFAEGKAGHTSVFVRARALEGREGSQKVIRVLPYYFRKFKMRLRTI